MSSMDCFSLVSVFVFVFIFIFVKFTSSFIERCNTMPFIAMTAQYRAGYTKASVRYKKMLGTVPMCMYVESKA